MNSTTVYAGSTGEWIVERPFVGSPSDLTNLANYQGTDGPPPRDQYQIVADYSAVTKGGDMLAPPDGPENDLLFLNMVCTNTGLGIWNPAGACPPVSGQWQQISITSFYGNSGPLPTRGVLTQVAGPAATQ